MYSIFSDPRTAARGSRRPQERRDFFPSFADSFFGDPFSSGVDESPMYREEEEEQQPLKQHPRAQHHQNPLVVADHLGAHPQQPHQQQRRQAPRQHQQHQNQEELHHQQHRHQIHRPPRQSHLQQQFQALKQQQERQQQPSNGPDHSDHHHQPPMANNLAGQQVPQRKRQGRRQRQRAQQGLTIKPVEAPEATDDMDSLVQAAFGEGAMSSPATKAPAIIPAATWKVHSQPQLKKNAQHGQKHPGHSQQSQQNQRHPGYTQARTQSEHGQHHPSYSLAQVQSQKPKHQNHHNHKPVETSEEEEEEEEEEEKDEDEDEDEEEEEEEEEDQEKQQSLDNEDEYPEYSEEEEMKPDPEVQARSNKELAEIRFSLDGLAQELDHIIGGVIPNKKQILMTEENLTKAMLKIDSVDSGGDDSIRKQRKDLVNRAEALLEKVDEFKARTNTHVRTRVK